MITRKNISYALHKTQSQVEENAINKGKKVMENILFKILSGIGLDEEQFMDAIFIMKETKLKTVDCVSILTQMGLMESEAIKYLENS